MGLIKMTIVTNTPDEGDDVLPCLSVGLSTDVVDFVEDHIPDHDDDNGVDASSLNHIPQTLGPSIAVWAEQEDLQTFRHSDEDLAVEGVLLEVSGVDALDNAAGGQVHLPLAEPCTNCG